MSDEQLIENGFSQIMWLGELAKVEFEPGDIERAEIPRAIE